METAQLINMKYWNLWEEEHLDKFSKLEKLTVKTNFLTMR